MSKYNLATSTWDEREKEALSEVIESGMFTMGKHVKKFEEKFAEYMGSKYAIMVNSGSSANLLMTAALTLKKDSPLKRGDEIIVPAVSWSTTYYPLHQYGLKMKFVDIDRQTLNYDLSALDEAVSENTKAIMIVNLLGNPNDIDRINSIISGRNIYIVEDNCESMGATYKGKQMGTHGLMGTFSSFFSHHICTMEGGVIVTDDLELKQLCTALRTHGWTRDLPKDNLVCEKGDDPFEESFRFVVPGYGLRPTELQGATGVIQMEKLAGFVKARQKNATNFFNKFSNRKDIHLQKEIGNSSWFGFAMIISEEAPYTRKELVKALKDAGVECRPIVAGDFTQNPVMKFLDTEIHGELKSARYINTNGLFVGNHHYTMNDEFELLENTLDSMSHKG